MAKTKGKKHQSQSQKAYFAAYPGKAESHRKRRQNRHSNRHPNDDIGGNTSYRRKTPSKEMGWATRQQEMNVDMGGGSYSLTEQPTPKAAKRYAQLAKFCKSVHRKYQYSRNKSVGNDQISNQLGYAEEAKQNQ